VEPSRQSNPDDRLAERTELTLLLGRLLFRYGASTQRIIDSMELLHKRLGGEKLEVLVTYDAITVTATESGRICTLVDASSEVAGVNIHAQGKIRRLLLQHEEETRDPARFRARLHEISSEPDLLAIFPWRWLAAGAVSAGFCAFNGGDWAAIGIAIAASLVIFAVRFELFRRKFSVYPATLGAVCVGGLVAALAARQGWSVTPDLALVAPVLFLVPGVPLITGGIDITRNHNSIGLARIAFTLVLTATLALGLAVSLPLVLTLPSDAAAPHAALWFRPLVDAAWGAVAAAGLAMLNGGHWRAIGVCAWCGAMARLVRECGVEFGIDPAGSALLAAVATTMLAIRLSTRHSMPSVILAVMGCLTLIPGFYAITGARVLFQLSVRGAEMPWPEAALGMQMMLQALFIAFGIVAGIILTFMVVERGSRRV
jgi:uncharacterized membrane protein YjjP (DUF1212 family)